MTKQQDSSQVSLPSDEDTNQRREVPMILQSSLFDRIDQQNPFVGMASNPCGGHSGDGK